MNSAIQLLTEAEKQVRDLDIPSREAVQALAKSALRMVAVDLANKNPKGALDTLDKMDAIEGYIKAKVQQEHADQVTQNVVAASRFRIRWEVGKWLDKYLVGTVRKGTSLPEKEVDKYWLEDVFGNNGFSAQHKSFEWQQLYRAFPEPEQLDEYLQPWEDPNNKQVDELMWKHVWIVVKPPKDKAEPEQLDVELSSAGDKLYRTIKDLRTNTINYFDYLTKNKVEVREMIFMAEVFKDAAANLLGAADQLGEAHDTRRG